jgi:hypothetical protein
VLDEALRICKILTKPEVSGALSNKNIKGTKNKEIQDLIFEKCCMENNGWETEEENLLVNSNIRVDFFHRQKKILGEVERGRTITNNMDILNLHRCHLIDSVDHLFLFILISVSHTRNIFNTVCKRIEPYFESGNHINVESTFIFGYP